jgi:hypothetical protein
VLGRTRLRVSAKRRAVAIAVISFVETIECRAVHSE